MRRLPLIVALATLTACSKYHEPAVEQSKADAYIASLTPASQDMRTSSLAGFARLADTMLSSDDPIDGFVDDLEQRRTCFVQSYAVRAPGKQTEMLDAIADTAERKRRWRSYVVASSSRAAIRAADACNY